MVNGRTRRRQVRTLETSRIQRVNPYARVGERATIQSRLDKKSEKLNESDREPGLPGRDHSAGSAPSIEAGRVRKWYGSATEIEARKREEERVRREMVRLEERTRIARELHDTLLQSFALASLQIGVAVANLPFDSCVRQQLGKVLHMVEQGIEEGRNAILGLRSAERTPLDLSRSLSSVQHEFLIQPDTDFRVVIDGKEQPLQEQVSREVYRIGREALVNALRHSRATRIELKLEYAESGLRMRVQDNGCGIDPGVLCVGRERHCGLTGMRERAVRVGGSLSILSRPTGTEVHLLIPGSIAFLSVAMHSTPDLELSCSC